MDPKTIDLLLATRPDYKTSCTADRFHLDAYAGTGGFSGSVRQEPSSYWGPSADAYGTVITGYGFDTTEASIDTYLDRFDREDLPKFKRRARVTHYENHVEPCVDIPVSYLRRKPLTRENVSEGLASWMQNATGGGVSWDTLVMGDVLLRGVVTGMCPVLFDLPAAEPTDAPRTAQDDAAEGRTVRAVPLFGAHLLDYGQDDHGCIEWAKLRFDYCEREGPLEPAIEVTRIHVLERDVITVYELRKSKGRWAFVSEDEIQNPFAPLIPLAIFRPKPLTGDPVRGISMIQNIAGEARRMFNLHSELDEHIRKSVFSSLQVPARNVAAAGKAVAGNGSALVVPIDSQRDYKWISPDQNVSSIIEKRLEATQSAIYAMARLAFVRGQIVSAAASGLSRQYEFEGTNRAVCDMAAQLAAFDQEALRIVQRVLEPTADQVHTSAAADYGVEDLDRELATVQSAAAARLGALANQRMRERVVAKLLPNLDAADAATIKAQIEQLAISEARSTAQGDALGAMGGAFNVDPAALGGGSDPNATATATDTSIGAVDEVSGGTVIAPELAKDPTKALNAAQIESLVAIVEAVATGQVPVESGLAILLAAYPFTEEQARAILDPIKVDKSPKPVPPAGAPPFVPGASNGATP